MFHKMKRFLSFILAVLMLSTVIPADVLAASMEETIVEETEIAEETEAVEEVEAVGETEDVKEADVVEEVEVTEVAEEVETEEAETVETVEEPENVAAVQKMTDFSPLSEAEQIYHISKADKPSLEQFLSVLPKTLEVTLEDGSQTEIEVSWYCVGEDYEESDAYYFQFSPVWDETKFEMTDESFDVITEAPYISVFLYDADMVDEAGVTSNSNEEKIFEFLVEEMNLSIAAACGILANIYHESGFNHKAVGDNGTSYGICQWHASRWNAMKTWCSNNGYDWTTLTGQLYYLKKELSANNSSYLYNGKTIYNQMLTYSNSAQNAYDAGYYWCVKFEVPANKETVGKTRGNLAKNSYWPVYKDWDKISTPKLSISDKSDSISVETSFSLTWTESVGKFNKYKLHIAKKSEKTGKYDWDNETVYSLSKDTTKYKISKGTLFEGSYAAYVVGYNSSTKKKSDKSNYIYFNIYDPITFDAEAVSDIFYYDATVSATLANPEEKVMTSVGFYFTDEAGTKQKIEIGTELTDTSLEMQHVLSEYVGELTQVTDYTVQFYAVANEIEYKSDKIKFTTTFNPSDSFWITEIPDQTYTGKKITPEIGVYDSEKLLVENVDYTLTYKNNVNVNDASVKKTAPYVLVTGKGNYSGTGKVYFKIVPEDISVEDVEVADVVVTETSKTQKPVPKVTYKGKTLTNKTDFKVSYPDTTAGAYKKAGTYEIVITGKGNFTGSRTATMTITECKQISKATVGKVSSHAYTGSAIEPEITVKYGKTLLEEGIDYEVSYENNVEIGTAKIIITGIGGYTGQKTVSFKITGKSLSKAKISNLITSVEYTGEEILQDYTLTMKVNGEEVTLQEGEDKDYIVSYEKNTKAGTAYIIFKGVNGYSGTVKKSFKIVPYSFTKDSEEKLEIESGIEIVYAKGGAKPKPEVKFGDVVLTEGVDYKLSYKNYKAVNDGSNPKKLPTITVTGKGNFKGTSSVNFTISEQDISLLELTIPDKTYKNKANAWKPTITIKDLDGKKLVAGTDYDKSNIVYTYEGNPVTSKDILPSDAVVDVTISGIGGYEGTISGSYRIVRASIANAKVKVKTYNYTGEEICPGKDEITVTVGGTKLTAEDYEIVSYSNYINKGTATMVLKGVGNYGGVKTVSYKIRSRSLLWWWL